MAEKTLIVNFDKLSVIKDDIRNYRKLDESQLNYIRTKTTCDEKMEIIELINVCISVVCKLLMSSDELLNSTTT
jgi:hypothetical protein